MNSALTHIQSTILSMKSDIQKEVIGQEKLIDKLLITFFSGGHALIEGVPGLGKTKAVNTMARVLGYTFKRISFTPDLLPSDLTGNEIFRPQTGKFETRKGPIFTNILLADEINRTPPKVQSALLEAMEERQVTIGEETLSLPTPFFVIATQNSLEHEGTYPLPEAQLDRFTLKILLSYPTAEDEKKIFLGSSQGNIQEKSEKSENVLSTSDFLEMIDYMSKNIRVDEKIYDYISEILIATRKLAIDSKTQESKLSYGASTRAGLALVRTSRVRALMCDRDYVLPEDIKYLAHDVLRHRVGLSYTSMSEGIRTDEVISEILENVQIP
ncbi:MoxR family ATPase [Candidatus Gracilibacteria bacterium]|nr:MoxR family ATPase [Candidatus Gracilibacteria bacterium]